MAGILQLGCITCPFFTQICSVLSTWCDSAFPPLARRTDSDAYVSVVPCEGTVSFFLRLYQKAGNEPFRAVRHVTSCCCTHLPRPLIMVV